MARLTVVFVLIGGGVLGTSAPAPAQYMMPPAFGYTGAGRIPRIVPSFNPFYYVPQYRYGSQFSFATPYGSFGFSSYQSYSAINNPYATLWALNQLQYAPSYAQGGSYLTGGVNTRADLVLAAQRNLAQAQREASTPGARAAIADQWDYEKGGAAPADGAGDPRNMLRGAVVAPEPEQIISGEALNEILKEVVRAEAKGAKGPSAFIPPLSLDEIRFAGSPAADLLNLARQAGSLHFPVAFESAALAAGRADLERDFAAVAVAVQAGKAPDPAKVAKLDATFQKVQNAADGTLKDLPFDDAAAARRFLNRMAGAIKALKGGAAAGLIDPKWAAEGLTVADLVKHMTRHKLQFGPAPRGRDEIYATMHRNLVTYLFVLTQPKR
jgi:hypothetical protein